MKRWIGAAVVVALGATLAACSQPAGGESGSGEIELWDWSMSDNTQPIVDLWNETHPDQPLVINNPGAEDFQTKLSAAIQAGDGPDASATFLQDIPALIANGSIDDSTAELAQFQDEYTPASWQSVQFGDQVYALPSDTGPMMMFYRADLFDQLGLTVPTTWEEYAEVAAAAKAAKPDSWIGTFSPGAGGWLNGLVTQAGGDWWAPDGDAWAVGFDSAPSQKVVSYWGDLVESGSVKVTGEWSTEWNADIAAGNVLTVIGAQWANFFLTAAAPDDAGKWAVAPLPQWDGEDEANSYYGGAAYMIPAGSGNREGAAEFIHWITSDPEAVKLRIEILSNFTTTKASRPTFETLASPAFLAPEPSVWSVAVKADAIGQATSYGPNVPVAYAALEDALSKAINDGSPFEGALSGVQSATIADLEDSGFTVAG